MGDYCHVNDASVLRPPSAAKKSNKIREIVRLQQMLKKWKKTATSSSKNNNNNNNNTNNTTTTTNNNIAVVAPKMSTTKGLNKFLKKTLSFSDISNSSSSSVSVEEVVRKGYLAVWVGREEDEMKKFVIPTDYLAHEAFSLLLRDAEEEFGFQKEGILKIPCDVPLFEKILKMITTTNNDNKKQQQQQRPTLKSSSSTSSFFLYDQDDQQQQQHTNQRSTTFNSQLKTPPTTPSTHHHLPLYCR